MDLNPKITKKYTPNVTVSMCETCLYKSGDFFDDPEDKKKLRAFCKARYTDVDVEQMRKYCDFYDKKVQ